MFLLNFSYSETTEDERNLHYYYFTLFYPTGFKGFLYLTILNKLTIPKSFFFLF
jgi:hypothetical protein